MSIWSGQFWKATAERAVTTAAEAVAALYVGDDVVGLFEMDAGHMFSVAGGMAVLSVLKSVAANKATGSGPSVTRRAEVVAVPDGDGRHRADV